MKKSIFFLLLSLICIPVFQLAKAIPEGIPLSSYSFQSMNTPLSKPVLNQLVYLPETPFSEADALIMINNLQKIDNSILTLALEQNIKINLFTGSLTDQNGLTSLKDKRPKGYSDSVANWNTVPGMASERVVYAKIGHSEYGKGHGSIALELHETAHAIDRYVFNYIRKDSMYLNIWNQEVKQLFPLQNYFIKFPEEYFAEVFAMYYYSDLTRKELEETVPLTFNFLQSLELQAAKRLSNTYIQSVYPIGIRGESINN